MGARGRADSRAPAAGVAAVVHGPAIAPPAPRPLLPALLEPAAEEQQRAPSSVSRAVVQFSTAWVGRASLVVLGGRWLLWRCWRFQIYADVRAGVLEGLSGLDLCFDLGAGVGAAEVGFEDVTGDAVAVAVDAVVAAAVAVE